MPQEMMMPTDVKKIAESRKGERDGHPADVRQAVALEHIADTLEAMRSDSVGFHLSLLRTLQANQAPK